MDEAEIEEIVGEMNFAIDNGADREELQECIKDWVKRLDGYAIKPKQELT